MYFHVLVDGFYKENNIDALLLIPDELVERGLPPDKSVHVSRIRSLCKKGLVDLAQTVLHQMQGKGLEADYVVYATLAYAQLTAGKLAVASDTVKEMAKRPLSMMP
jgi:pentatricopeptide repeat protein